MWQTQQGTWSAPLLPPADEYAALGPNVKPMHPTKEHPCHCAYTRQSTSTATKHIDNQQQRQHIKTNTRGGARQTQRRRQPMRVTEACRLPTLTPTSFLPTSTTTSGTPLSLENHARRRFTVSPHTPPLVPPPSLEHSPKPQRGSAYTMHYLVGPISACLSPILCISVPHIIYIFN